MTIRSTGRWLLIYSVVGLCAGLGGVAFQICCQYTMRWGLTAVAGYQPGDARGEKRIVPRPTEAPEFSPLMLIALLVAGGLVSGQIVQRLAPETEGGGTDAVIDAFHNKRGMVRARVPLVKTVATAIVMGSGGSIGREGPVTQIGAGISSQLAQLFKMSVRERRILLAAGMGAGVSAVFRAPLASALFSAEILYHEGDLESDVLVPSVMASIVSYSVANLLMPGPVPFMPLFLGPDGRMLEFGFGSLWELIGYGMLALTLVLGGMLYVSSLRGIRNLFHRGRLPKAYRPALGMGLAGCLGVACYLGTGNNLQALGTISTGYGVLQSVLDETTRLSLGLLFVIAVGKIFATALTIGSGATGGLFGPSLVIGGCLGAAVAEILTDVAPLLVFRPGAYIVVGMAGFFAANARAPLSTVVMVTELTGNYELLLPTLWVSLLCFLLGHRWKLFTTQVSNRLESPAHRGDYIVDILEGITIREVLPQQGKTMTLFEGTSLDEIVHTLPSTRQHDFPVVDENQCVVGMLSLDEIRSFLYDDTLWHLTVARDLVARNFTALYPDDDLNVALQKFTVSGLEELPVLERQDDPKLIGLLNRATLIAFYNTRLLELKRSKHEELSSIELN